MSTESALSAVESPVEPRNISNEGRIWWYIELTIAKQKQPGSSDHWDKVKRKIYSDYLFTKQGREKLIQSMVRPSLARYNYYRKLVDTHTESLDWSWGGVLEGIKDLIIDHENLISVMPEEEQFSGPFFEIRSIIQDMFTLYKDALKASDGLDLSEVIQGTALTEADRLPLDTSSPSV
jgi:hypothetical protein